MKSTIPRIIGFVFLVLSIILLVALIMLAIAAGRGSIDVEFWFSLLLIVIYSGSLFIAFWRLSLSGLLLIVTGIAIGLPNAIINVWAGLIYGLPPLIAGLAFLIAGVYSTVSEHSAVKHTD